MLRCTLVRANGNRVILADGTSRLVQPGDMWFCPWYHDPDAIGAATRAAERLALAERDPAANYLSVHYWRDHALRRPPICVVGPNGSHWMVDSRSPGGAGWTVTGEAPLISASPSVALGGSEYRGDGTRTVRPDYHGILSDGVFSADLSGRPTTAFSLAVDRRAA